uniref:Uncharacterized protein n=1 Tax=Glossina palpalis gambiensis TaxID=67801 RepID=A0A1B0BVS9_9MUSC
MTAPNVELQHLDKGATRCPSEELLASLDRKNASEHLNKTTNNTLAGCCIIHASIKTVDFDQDLKNKKK